MSNYYKNRKEIELKVGVFFVVGLIALVLGIAFLKDIAFNRDNESLRVKFESTNGLDPGDKVKINGIDVGKIEDISLVEDGVLVLASVEKQQFKLGEDSKFLASESSLMGGHHLDIVPGRSTNPLSFDKVHVGENGSSIYSVIGDAKTLMNNLSNTIEYLNGNLEIIDSTKVLLSNAGNAIKEVQDVIVSNKDDIKSLISSLNHSSKEIVNLLDTNKSYIDSTLVQAPAIASNLNQNLNDMKVVVSKLNSILDKYESNDNSVKKLLEDKELHDKLIQTINSADSLINDVKKHPSKYITIEIF